MQSACEDRALRQTFFVCLLCMYIMSAAAMRTTTVESCSELKSALGAKSLVDRILIGGDFECRQERYAESYEIKKNLIIEGPDTSYRPASIDWGDTSALLVATANVEITIRNLIFIQDSPGMTGLSMNFLNAKEGASVVFEDIGVGLRRCARPIGHYDEKLLGLPRPESVEGKQRAVKVGDKGLGMLDVAFTSSAPEAQWRICNGLFKCEVESSDDALLSRFVTKFRGVRCSEPTFFKQVVGLLGDAMEAKEPETKKHKGFLSFKWTLVILTVLTAAILLLAIVAVRKFILPYYRSKREKETGSNNLVDDKFANTEDLAMPSTEENIDLGSIELGDLVGRGPFGVVYKGHRGGVPLAVKAIDHEEINNMSEISEYLEAYIHCQMHHNNVVRTYLFQTMMDDLYKNLISSWALRSVDAVDNTLSTDVEDGGNSFKARYNSYRTFIVMEYCDLGSLSLAIQNGAFHSYEPRFKVLVLDVLHTALEIAKGMKHLHSMRLIHGDLKPSNILLRRNRAHWRGFECKVTDYGMSPFCSNKATIESSSLDVIMHIAPEQLDVGVLSQTGDVYSFGLLLWQMLACETPLMHMRPDVAVSDIIAGERPKIPDFFPDHCSKLIQECWQEHHQLRPSFTFIVDQLKGIIGDITRKGEEQVEISLGRIKAPFCETASFVGYESSFVDRHESDDLQSSLDQIHIRSKSLGRDEPFLETDCNLLPPVPGLDLSSSQYYDEEGVKNSNRQTFPSARGSDAV